MRHYSSSLEGLSGAVVGICIGRLTRALSREEQGGILDRPKDQTDGVFGAEVAPTARNWLQCQLAEVGQPSASCVRRQFAEVKTTSVPKQANAVCSSALR